MKVGIVVPYFGTLPNYFQLFLDSCESNYKFEWIIFTNDRTDYNYPKNVHPIYMTFKECRNLTQSKFSFTIELSRPQKLCDYKCAYGYIFKDYLKDYDWWGYCDLDQIFGDLSVFITDDMLNKYDKIGSIGHFTLYKNTDENCKMFMNSLNGKLRYQEVFTSTKGCAFDEWLPENINDIYLDSNKKLILDNYGADINSYRTQLSLVQFDVTQRKYVQSSIKNSIFKVTNGKVYQVFKTNNHIDEIEYPYVHLQKRKMKDKRTIKNSKDYFIIPNSFIDINNDANKLLNKCTKWNFINYQFFRVKFNSLKYRLKNKDWKFSSVFKM